MWRVSWCLFTLVLCVAIEGGHIQVRVNRMFLQSVFERPSPTPASAPVVADVEYRYVDGDDADVWCLSSWIDCDLRLYYDFNEEHLGGEGNMTDNSTATNYKLLGVRTSLGAAHHGSSVVCECTATSHLKYAINVRLVRTSFNGMLELNVGSMCLRYEQPSLLRTSGYAVSYAYKQSERFMWSSRSDVPHVLLDTYKNGIRVPEANTSHIEVMPNDVIRIAARNETTTLRSVTVVFNYNLTDNIYEATPLSMNTSRSLLELYRYDGDQLVYYQFDVEQPLILECKTAAGVVSTYDYRLVFGDIVESRNDSIIKEIQLNATNDNTSIDCCLVNNRDNTTVRNIRVVFRARGGTTADAVYVLVPAVGGAVCGLLLCVALGTVVVCCVRRYNRAAARKSEGDHSEQKIRDRDDPPIPAYPSQWN